MTTSHHAPSHASPNAAAQPAGEATSSTPLERALVQSEAAAGTVQKSADELLVINAVLKHEIPDHVQTSDLAQALQKTDDLEVKIQDAAQELTHVNEVLTQEIAERGELETRLAAATAALAKTGPGA